MQTAPKERGNEIRYPGDICRECTLLPRDQNTQAARYETINPNRLARRLKLMIGSGASWEEPFLYALLLSEHRC